MRTVNAYDDPGTAGLLATAILNRPMAPTAGAGLQTGRAAIEWRIAELMGCLGTGGHLGEISECAVEGTTAYGILDYSQPADAALLSGTSERISFIRSMLSLQVKELAAALLVGRPSVYAWMAGTAQPQARNRRRMETIWALAKEWGRLSRLPLSSMRKAPDESGSSIVDLLMADEIDTARVVELMRAASAKLAADRAMARGLSLRERARRSGMGIATPPNAQRKIDALTGKRISTE